MTMLGVLIPWVLMTRVSLIRFPPKSLQSKYDLNLLLHRMNKFLNREELPVLAVEENEEKNTKRPQNNSANITNGMFSWSSTEPAFLQDIQLEVAPEQLVAVVGRVGSGKSSLLAALLGEMKQSGGKLVICDNTAYLPQQAWVQNCSIRENILFCKVWNTLLVRLCQC